MTEKSRLVVLNDAQWAVLAPLIDECRPRGKTEPVALRQTIEAIVWRHQTGGIRTERNGAACLLIWCPGGERRKPSSAGTIWVFGNGFSTWPRSAAWRWAWFFSMERRSGRTTKRRERQKTGDLERSAMGVKPLAVLAAATARKPA